MLWHKAWLETRWRFVIGAVVLACSAAEVVLVYPRVSAVLTAAGANVDRQLFDTSGPIGDRIGETVALARDYRGYVWSQAFRASFANLVTLFAVLLGAGGLAPHGAGSGGLFTLSLPVSRRTLFRVRALTGVIELFVLVMLASLLIPVLSLVIGEQYGVLAALVHGVCLFIGSAVFFSLAILLSTETGDVWRPLLIALFAAIALGSLEAWTPGLTRYGIFAAMRGEPYFRTGTFPWAGLAISAALSVLLLHAAALNFARRDF
jgi:ABC-type transport system involved in multi-copper enzyme maturation permease subunit